MFVCTIIDVWRNIILMMTIEKLCRILARRPIISISCVENLLVRCVEHLYLWHSMLHPHLWLNSNGICIASCRLGFVELITTYGVELVAVDCDWRDFFVPTMYSVLICSWTGQFPCWIVWKNLLARYFHFNIHLWEPNHYMIMSLNAVTPCVSSIATFSFW